VAKIPMTVRKKVSAGMFVVCSVTGRGLEQFDARDL